LKFLDNISFNKFRNISQQPRVEINQENNQKQQNNPSNFFKTDKNDEFIPSFKRLNDLDTNILNNNLFKFLPLDSLRIELQLELSEKRMKDVETDMKVLSFLGYDKESKNYDALEQRKQFIQEEILNYRKEYRDLGAIYKVADTVTDIFQKTRNKALDTKVAFMGTSFVKGIKDFFPGIKVGDEIKQTLNNSLLFNKSVSNLLSTTVTPFGENEQRFNELAQMMVKANSLDFKISKLLYSAKEAGSKINNHFQDGYNKIITGINNFMDKLKLPLPKIKSQENFFETLAGKADFHE